MVRTEIPRDQWHSFCDEFSRLHRGWLVTIGVIDTQLLEASAEARAHALTDDLIFQGITEEEKRGHTDLAIAAGEGEFHIAHAVHEPQHLYLESTEDGAHKGMRIDEADGHTTLLRFRASVPAEALNGLTETER